MKVLEDKNYIYVYVLQYKVISSQVLVLKILMTMKKSGKKKKEKWWLVSIYCSDFSIIR